MKILVCGGRNYNNRENVYATLDSLTSHLDAPDIHIIHGGARGADTLARDWADNKGCRVTAFPANWSRYGKRAGYIRNKQMADERPDLIVAFPGGKGTSMMIDIGLGLAIHVIDLKE